MRGFANFLLLRDKDFYTSRPQLFELADVMADFIGNGKTSDVLNISLPARFGKSRIATDFSIWQLATAPDMRILRASYSADLAETFSTQVRAGLTDFASSVGYQIETSGTRSRWRIGKRTQPSHVGTGVAGTITGFGCDIAIIDDTAKNIIDATSAAYRRQLDSFRESVLFSRLEGMKKIINVGTRWAVNDWFSNFPDAETFIVRAMNEDGTSCCEAWKTTAELQLDKKRIRDYIWSAQYQQAPTATGRVRLFEGFRFRMEEDPKEGDRFMIIDPATDFGTDYFVIGYYKRLNGQLYLIDMKAKQSMTVDEAAAWIMSHDYDMAYCEANGAGRNIINELVKRGVHDIVGFTTRADKYSRAFLKQEQVRNYVAICPTCSPLAVEELTRQADEFPVGDHDDLIDDVVMAVEKLLN